MNQSDREENKSKDSVERGSFIDEGNRKKDLIRTFAMDSLLVRECAKTKGVISTKH